MDFDEIPNENKDTWQLEIGEETKGRKEVISTFFEDSEERKSAQQK